MNRYVFLYRDTGTTGLPFNIKVIESDSFNAALRQWEKEKGPTWNLLQVTKTG